MEESERASRAKSEFLSRMSHELRTPLNAIIGFGQLLQMEDENSSYAGRQANIKRILAGGHHLLQLINEVLDLAKIESGTRFCRMPKPAARPSVRLLTAPDARLGIDLALGHRPDLILMDINLPGMSGMEALEILKSRDEIRHIPVVAVSANAIRRDIEKALLLGFKDYIIKPINVVGLLKVADDILFPSPH